MALECVCKHKKWEHLPCSHLSVLIYHSGCECVSACVNEFVCDLMSVLLMRQSCGISSIQQRPSYKKTITLPQQHKQTTTFV